MSCTPVTNMHQIMNWTPTVSLSGYICPPTCPHLTSIPGEKANRRKTVCWRLWRAGSLQGSGNISVLSNTPLIRDILSYSYLSFAICSLKECWNFHHARSLRDPLWSILHTFSKRLLSIHYVPGTCQGLGLRQWTGQGTFLLVGLMR